MTTQEPVKPHHSRIPFIITLLVILLTALIFWVKVIPGSGSRPNIAIVTSSTSDYWDLVVKGAQDAADELNADLTVILSEANVNEQNKHLHDLMAKRINGIAVSPLDPVMQTDLLNNVATQTNLVTFDSDAPGSDRIAYIGTANYSAGWHCARQIMEALPEGGEVVICIGSLDKVNARLRRQGVIDGLLARSSDPDREADPLDKPLVGPSYTIVATLLDTEDRQIATERISEAIKQYPELKCLATLHAENGPAALDAIERMDLVGQIKIIAFDEASEVQAGIESGAVYAAILQDQYMTGYNTVRTLVELHRGARWTEGLMDETYYHSCRILTAGNIESLRERGRLRQPE